MDRSMSPRQHELFQLPSTSSSPSVASSASRSSNRQLIEEILSRITINKNEEEVNEGNSHDNGTTDYEEDEGEEEEDDDLNKLSTFEDDEDKYAAVTMQASLEEQEAEQWLTRRQEIMVSINWDDRIPHETMSTMSSPGKTSMRERLRHRLMKHNSDGSPQHSIEETPENEANRDLGANVRSNSAEDNGDEDDRYTRIGPPPPPPPRAVAVGSSMPVFENSPHSGRDDDQERRHALTPMPLERKEPLPVTRPRTHAPPQLNDSVLRLSRTVRYGRRGEVPVVTRKINRVRLHVYDLIRTDTMMRLPWGCDFPIGKCFQAMNNGLHALGTGAYHCGIEINGIEYAYGANELAGLTGVFTCMPKHSPGYEYRSTIDFGDRQVKRTEWTLQNTECSLKSKESSYREISSYLDGHDVMKEMASEYHGMDYDLLRKNCCTFAKDASLRLGVSEAEIPRWFMNLANAGARTQDFSEKAWEPIAYFIPQGTTEVKPQKKQEKRTTGEGFEVIALNKKGVFRVVEAVDSSEKVDGEIGVRRTLSWTY